MKKNYELSKIFDEMASILEFKGENPFKVNAYRRASRLLEGLGEDIETVAKEGRLSSIQGIGTGIAKKIQEYIETGKMTKYEEVKRDVPEGLIDLLGIQGLGPKTLALAHKELGVGNLLDLERAIQTGTLERLPGMGKKKVENILRGIKFFQTSRERLLLGIALPIVEEIISHLRGLKEVFRISACGSLRRMKETIGDIDILVSSKEGKKVITAFTSLPVVKEVLLCGETKGSIITHDGVQVDLRVVDEGSFGSALQYFTGSKAHNIKLRDIAKRKGMKISEYGVFIGDKKIGGSKEEEIYEAIGLSWIPPELREDWGEVEMARGGRLPRIIEREDVVGDLHVHSDHSDGASSILELALKAKELGYRYIVICDHSRSARYANGLSVERLLAQMEEISRLNSRIDGVRILTGTEVDILKDGSLDYPDEILKRCDIVIGAIHQGFKLNVTQRICKAMENPHLDIVAHPTGRLISQREGYEVDVEVVMKEAARTNTALEINAYYDRLDLSDVNTKRAKELGVKFSIGTDAHSAQQLEMMQFGLGVARRGWCTKDDILNALPPEELLSR